MLKPKNGLIKRPIIKLMKMAKVTNPFLFCIILDPVFRFLVIIGLFKYSSCLKLEAALRFFPIEKCVYLFFLFRFILPNFQQPNDA